MALKRNSILALVFGMFVAVGLLLYAFGAHANPSDFTTVKSAASTTTVTYIVSGGNATTTPYDALNGDNAADSAVLLTQFAASSTSSVLGIKIQYSQDGIDWYDDNLLESTNSTTSPTYSMQIPNTYSWTAVGTATSSKAIAVPTPTRYVRAVYTMTGAAGAVWNQMVVKKQTPE